MVYDLLNAKSIHKPYSNSWYVELLRKKLDYVVNNKDSSSIDLIVKQTYWLANCMIKDKIENADIKKNFIENVVFYLEIIDSTLDKTLLDDVYKNVKKVEIQLNS